MTTIQQHVPQQPVHKVHHTVHTTHHHHPVAKTHKPAPAGDQSQTTTPAAAPVTVPPAPTGKVKLGDPKQVAATAKDLAAAKDAAAKLQTKLDASKPFEQAYAAHKAAYQRTQQAHDRVNNATKALESAKQGVADKTAAVEDMRKNWETLKKQMGPDALNRAWKQVNDEVDQANREVTAKQTELAAAQGENRTAVEALGPADDNLASAQATYNQATGATAEERQMTPDDLHHAIEGFPAALDGANKQAQDAQARLSALLPNQGPELV